MIFDNLGPGQDIDPNDVQGFFSDEVSLVVSLFYHSIYQPHVNPKREDTTMVRTKKSELKTLLKTLTKTGLTDDQREDLNDQFGEERVTEMLREIQIDQIKEDMIEQLRPTFQELKRQASSLAKTNDMRVRMTITVNRHGEVKRSRIHPGGGSRSKSLTDFKSEDEARDGDYAFRINGNFKGYHSLSGAVQKTIGKASTSFKTQVGMAASQASNIIDDQGDIEFEDTKGNNYEASLK